MNRALKADPAHRRPGLRHPPPASRRNRRFNILVTLFAHVLPIAAVVYVAIRAAFAAIYPSTLDLVLCLGLYVVTLLGLEIGYHRYFAHSAFKTSPAFELVLAFLGTVTFEGGVIWWTGTHRRHHAFSDGEGDPHSPHFGRRGSAGDFFYAHMGWLFKASNTNLGPWVQHVLPMYRKRPLGFLNQYYFQIGVAFLLLPAVLGGLIGGGIEAAWSGFLWGGLVRVFLVTHAIFSLNSVCHMFGSRPFAHLRDRSRNSAWLAPYTLGASWHNNHHAFPRTASNQFRWWEIDIAGAVIHVLEKLGVVWDVWRPTPELVRMRRSGVGVRAHSCDDGDDAPPVHQTETVTHAHND